MRSKRNQRAQASKNVLMKDGSARRLALDEAEELIKSGAARRFISNTIYRALQLGIKVTNFDDRDDKGKLRAAIKAEKDKAAATRHKAEQKKPKEQELVETA